MMSVMYGIRLTPFQGSESCLLMDTGHCPVFLIMPLQGNLWITKILLRS
jgi:hypothetical protein